jgi:hypothetical protein
MVTNAERGHPGPVLECTTIPWYDCPFVNTGHPVLLEGQGVVRIQRAVAKRVDGGPGVRTDGSEEHFAIFA